MSKCAPNATIELSPHEVLIGRPMVTEASPALTPHKTTLFWTDEYMTEYIKRPEKVSFAGVKQSSLFIHFEWVSLC